MKELIERLLIAANKEADALEHLTAKNNDLERLHAAVTIQVTQRQHKIDKLIAERDALKADAAKYLALLNCVRKNLANGMSKSIQLLQAKTIWEEVGTAIQGAKT